jgi:hypothetical protein
MRRAHRRAALGVHLWSGGAWIGMDLVLGILVVTALTTDDVALRAVCLQAFELFAIWPLTLVGLLCLVSGVLLGLGTPYGLLRYWWVAVKLAINLVLSTLVIVLLGPGMRRAGEQGRELAAGGAVSTDVSSLVMPPTVTIVALTVAVWLSVVKPWGRIGRSRRD